MKRSLHSSNQRYNVNVNDEGDIFVDVSSSQQNTPSQTEGRKSDLEKIVIVGSGTLMISR